MARSVFQAGIAASLGLLAACGGSSDPLAPSEGPTSPVGGASTVTVTGRVVETVSGNHVAGARMDASGMSVTASGDGAFELPSIPLGATVPITVSSPNHVTRRTFLRGATGTSVTVDVIEESPLWNLDFYRELARNGAGGGDLQALNPWTMEPGFYVDRRPESGSGREIPEVSVDLVVEAIGEVVPLLTKGRWRGDQIQVGADPPPDMTLGTVVIRWDPVEVSESGAASGIAKGVGGNANVVLIRSIEETRVVYHELGHVLGLYHPLGGIRPSLMSGPGRPEPPHFTEWDIFHAQALYGRPPGNTDIDNDPSGFVLGRTLGTSGTSPIIQICPRS